MAGKRSEMALALVVVLMTWNGVLAQSGCSNALMTLVPCLNFVTGNLTKPSSACCSSLTGVVQTQPQCLCSMINGGGAMVGLGVNQTLALSLPSACNVQTQPISRCKGASGPTSSAASPASAPVGSPSSDSTPSYSSSVDTPVTTTKTPSTPSQTNTPLTTGTGSKSTPSTIVASSGASTTSLQLPVVVFVSLTVSFALSATKF